MSIEAMKQALDALEECRRDPRLKYEHLVYDKTITALRTAIEQARSAPEQKYLGLKPCWYESKEEKMCPKCGQVHAGAIFSAAQRQWVGLTDEERRACAQSPFVWENYLAIEAKLKEKNT